MMEASSQNHSSSRGCRSSGSTITKCRRGNPIWSRKWTKFRYRLVLMLAEDADTEHLRGHSGGRLAPHPLEQPIPMVGAVQRPEQYGVTPPGSKPVPEVAGNRFVTKAGPPQALAGEALALRLLDAHHFESGHSWPGRPGGLQRYRPRAAVPLASPAATASSMSARPSTVASRNSTSMETLEKNSRARNLGWTTHGPRPGKAPETTSRRADRPTWTWESGWRTGMRSGYGRSSAESWCIDAMRGQRWARARQIVPASPLPARPESARNGCAPSREAGTKATRPARTTMRLSLSKSRIDADGRWRET